MTGRLTLTDIARAAGVSTATVSRVLNGNGIVSAETVERVNRVAEELNFQVSNRKRTRPATRTIALVLNHLDWPVVPSWLSEIHRNITSFGYNTIVAASEGGSSTRLHCVRLITEGQVDGAIFYSPQGATYDEIAERLGLDQPVKYGRGLFCLDLHQQSGFHVLMDEDQIGRIAASHLISAGATNIAMIGGPAELPAAQTREQAFLRNLADLGRGTAEILQESAQNWSFEGGYSAMDALLARDPSINGLFVSSDNAAIGAIRLLRERNVGIEGRIAIVSVDNMPHSAFSTPSLTTIDTRLADRAQVAVAELMGLLQDKRTHVDDISMSVRLVVRESSASLEQN
jgi:LacI family transcriptional regulator